MSRHQRFEKISAALPVVVTLGIAMIAARLIVQIFFADTAFGGTAGLLTLYGETLAIGVGLAALRTLERASSPSSERFDGEPTYLAY